MTPQRKTELRLLAARYNTTEAELLEVLRFREPGTSDDELVKGAMKRESMAKIYFNEHDKFAAQWLRNLFPGSRVDERDIRDVKADDVLGFERCHFFGGIGGWEYALQLAGWPSEWPVWTGSCPCQPFSQAGKRKAQEDERHLWPEFFRLISECRPPIVIGEQVASSDVVMQYPEIWDAASPNFAAWQQVQEAIASEGYVVTATQFVPPSLPSSSAP